MVGQTLDRYRIDAKIGEGGMGVVYKAHDTQLDRTVAIKVLPHDRMADAERRQRFVHEARAASALNHPNIVTLHDIRADAGIDFIVMEYVNGRTLDTHIPPKGMDVRRALRCGVQIADALARAHEAGIVHRDLKPANVIVTGDDRVKVLDFGLAKLVEPVEATQAPTRTSPLTDAGTIVGTTAYMSPEQAEGRRVDGRSDIFSFGAILYEMLTGRRPFTADSNLAVLGKIVNEDPAPPASLNPSIPADVERAVLRCLRKDPARRYQTMADLKVALDDLITDSTASQPALSIASRGPSRWRWAWAAAVPLLLVVAYLAMTSRGRPAPPAAGSMAAVPLTSLPGVEDSPSFSPDGNQVAFTWTGADGGNADVYVQQIGAGDPLRITTDPASDYSAMWSPDGRAIAFLRQTAANPLRHELRLVPPLGGPDRRVTEIQPRGFLRPVTLSWCPDSQCIVLTDSSGEGLPDALFVVSLATGEKRQLTAPDRAILADTDPAISPDGRWLAFRRDVAPFSGRLMFLALDGALNPAGEPRPFTDTLQIAYSPRWISDTEVTFSAKGALWRVSTDVGATPSRLPFVGEDGRNPFVSSARAGQATRLVYVRSYQDTNVWRIDTSAPGAPASSAPTQAVSSTRADFMARISPDGRRVGFMSTRSGENEVWTSDLTGANAVQLTSLNANPGYVSWSPDGTLIAFHSNSLERASGNIFVVSADGGRPRNLTPDDSTSVMPMFSRDGRWIYFQSNRGGQFGVWKIPSEGGDAVKVVDPLAMRAMESPDGQFLYYVESARTDQPGALWRRPVTGGVPMKVLESVLPANYDVVDGGIYYTERSDGDTSLRYHDLASGRSRVVAERLGVVGFGLTASRDGRMVVFTRTDSSVDDLMLVDNFR